MPRVDVLGRLERAVREAGVRPGDRLIAAVSGGVDSMVLLDALHRLRDRLKVHPIAVHVHHGLRGAEADRDATFVVAEARRRRLPAHVVRLDPATRPPGTSVQVWAREARYRHLEEARRRLRAAYILTAHQRNDQAETILLNLLRGTGPRGLAGIPVERGRILRPLLAADRESIALYADRHGVAFREDASNRSDAYRRNRVRQELLPLLAARYNPRIVDSLADLAERAREDEAALAEAAARRLRRLARRDGATLSVPAAALGAAAPALARRVVELLFRQAAGPDGHLTRRHVTAILGLLRRAGSVPLPGGFRATRAGDRIVVGAPSGLRGAGKGGDGGAAPMRIDLPVGRWVAWPALSWQVRIRRAPAGVRPGRGLLWSALVDAAILRAPLALRAWQAGDRFHPLGAPGRKKLQDFFVDAKVARPLRGKIPLLVGAGEIVCVVGYRAAEGCRARGRGEAACIEVRRREGSDAVSAGIGLDPCAPDPGPGRGVGGRHLR